MSYNDHNEKIKNTVLLEAVTCGKKHIIECDEVEARKIKVLVKQEQDCCFVFAGDEIKYKIKITNESDVKLFNLEFKDKFSDETEYEPGSFKVNGKREHPEVEGHTICYKIEELGAHDDIYITFDVKVK